MKKKGTVGSFTEYCGGKVTDKCIDSALNSNDETLRKRAQFAKNVREMQFGGTADSTKQDSIIRESQFPPAMPPDGTITPSTTLPDTTMRGRTLDPNLMKQIGKVDRSKIRNYQSGGESDADDAVITDGRKMGGEKSRRLPGGVMKPIGHGAYKFMGNKHDESGLGSNSGIILEKGGKSKPGLEVEDGELQVDVDTSKGKKEYIVSNYIKNPATGNTLAEDLERELKRAKNNQEAAKITARYVRLNESLRREDDDDDMEEAQEGRPKTMGFPDAEYPYDALQGDYQGSALTAEESDIGNQRTTDEKLFGKATMEGYEKMKKANPWYDWKDFDPTSKEDVKKFQEEFNERAPEGEKLVVDGKYGTQTQSAVLDKKYYPKEEPKEEAPKEEEPAPEEPAEEAPAPEEEPAEEPAPEPAAEGDPAKFRPTMPGTMLQALGPAYALTQELSTQKMKPEYAREVRMGRVDLDQQRAQAARQSQGASAGITSSVAGPAALAMQQANLAQGQAAQRGITDQENKANISIANQEKGINAGIRQQNAANAMQASQVNAAAQNQTNMLNQQRKIEAMNQLGKIGTQTVKDYNQQYANFGSDMMEYGPVAADYYANTYRGNTPFGLGSRDINMTQMDPAEVTAMYERMKKENPTTEPEAETTTGRKGGYIKRSNKVRRKRKYRRR